MGMIAWAVNINSRMKIVHQNYIYESIEENKITTNSLGEQISNSVESISNFWKWFGNSKAIDDKGRPIVFYHGSYGEFEEFEHPWDRDDNEEDYSEGYNGGNLGVGFYFTQNQEYASRFGKPGKYYLKITNLLDLNNENNIEILNSRFEEDKDDLMYGVMGETIDEIMKEEKYDGVFAMGAGGLSYGADEWKVVNGSQIKSLNNSGVFANNNKIAGE